MAHIDISNAGSPEILDQIIVLAQLGEVARRAHTVVVDRVETIVERPRKYYVLGEHRASTVMSAPVFTLDGAFVGMGGMRAIRSRGGGGMGDNYLVIVVAANDIQAMAQHAPAQGEGPPELAPPPDEAEPDAAEQDPDEGSEEGPEEAEIL
jgi:hypothetical protein